MTAVRSDPKETAREEVADIQSGHERRGALQNEIPLPSICKDLSFLREKLHMGLPCLINFFQYTLHLSH